MGRACSPFKQKLHSTVSRRDFLGGATVAGVAIAILTTPPPANHSPPGVSPSGFGPVGSGPRRNGSAEARPLGCGSAAPRPGANGQPEPTPGLVLAGFVERLGIARSGARTGVNNIDLHVPLVVPFIRSALIRSGQLAPNRLKRPSEPARRTRLFQRSRSITISRLILLANFAISTKTCCNSGS